MVLSNKKLKLKLRAAKAETLAASEERIDSTKPDPKKLQTQQSLRSLLDSLYQKPRLSKREKRRVLSLQEGAEVVNTSGDSGAKRESEGGGSKDVNEQKTEREKKRKRKRGEGEESESGVPDKVEVKKAKKSKKKKKGKRKVKVKEVENEELKEVVESGNGESAGQGVAEAIKSTDGEENVDVTRKVYVGGIPYYSTEDDIRSYFEGCGTITEVDCMKFPESGKFRGIAIIKFKTEAAARRALALDGSDMGGLFLKIQPYKSTRANKVSDFSPTIMEGYNRIYVGNLSWDITEEELRKLFSDCSVTSIRFGEDKETGKFRGYAHVDFANSLSLTMALKLDQKIVFGRPVRIKCAVPKKGAETSLKSTQISKDVVDGGTNSISKEVVDGGTSYVGKEVVDGGTSSIGMEVVDGGTSSMGKDVVDGGTSSISGKIRRRTCYECGEKGHLSSSCPNKQVAAALVHSS